MRFTILSKTSREILSMLDDFQIDAGLTYLDNEPLGELHTVPLYHERYQLLTRAGSPLGERDKVTWADVARIPALPARRPTCKTAALSTGCW